MLSDVSQSLVGEKFHQSVLKTVTFVVEELNSYGYEENIGFEFCRKVGVVEKFDSVFLGCNDKPSAFWH